MFCRQLIARPVLPGADRLENTVCELQRPRRQLPNPCVLHALPVAPLRCRLTVYRSHLDRATRHRRDARSTPVLRTGWVEAYELPPTQRAEGNLERKKAYLSAASRIAVVTTLSSAGASASNWPRLSHRSICSCQTSRSNHPKPPSASTPAFSLMPSRI